MVHSTSVRRRSAGKERCRLRARVFRQRSPPTSPPSARLEIRPLHQTLPRLHATRNGVSSSSRRISLTSNPSFDLIVIGAGGGPSEDDLSSYFLKSRHQSWARGLVAIEAGSGLGSIVRLLADSNSKSIFDDFDLSHPLSAPVGPLACNSRSPKKRRAAAVAASALDASTQDPPLCVLANDAAQAGAREAPEHGLSRSHALHKRARDIYSLIHSFLITHSHLDHISSLILTAGSLSNGPKAVWSARPTRVSLDRIFNVGLWPRLADSTGKLPLWLRTIECGPGAPLISVLPSLSVQAFTLNHGTTREPEPGNGTLAPRRLDPLEEDVQAAHENPGQAQNYYSTAFLITETKTLEQFIFFGDLEPDSLRSDPKEKLNLVVWEHVARGFKKRKLKTIFIECSYSSARPRHLLYGHLSPIYLFEELSTLARQVIKLDGLGGDAEIPPPEEGEGPPHQGVLGGLNVVIIHIKEELEPPTLPWSPSSDEDDVGNNSVPEGMDEAARILAAHDRQHSPSCSEPHHLPTHGNNIDLPHGVPPPKLGAITTKEGQEQGSARACTLSIKDQILSEILALERHRFRLGCRFWIANRGDRFEF